MKAWLGVCSCLALTALATSCPQTNLSKGIVVTRPVALAPSATLPLSEPVTLIPSVVSPVDYGTTFTARLEYGFLAAGDTYAWFLNGELLPALTGQTVMLDSGDLGLSMDAGRYTLSGVVHHNGFSYAVDWVFEVQ